MTMKQLTEWVRVQINTHPNLASEILDYYGLCVDEMEEGGSEQHEIDLCINSIEQLIEERV